MKQFFYILFFCLSFYAYTKEQYKHFVIDICSYNNKKWVARNLKSAVNQRYPKEFFHIYYTDDCSTDGTREYVEQYIKRYGLQDTITLVKNSERRRALANHYSVVHRCDDDAIIIHLDGDDYFANTNVLSYLNTVYQDSAVWATYGAMGYSPSWRAKEVPACLPITQEMRENNSYRTYLKGPYHPRTFYAWLAKLVKLVDLLCPDDIFDMQGQFFPSCADWALMFPILEMAGTHVKYIEDQILTIYNLETPFNVYKCDGKKQDVSGAIIRSKQPYATLKMPCKNNYALTGPALLLFCPSDISCATLEKFLLSWVMYAHGCAGMYVFIPDTIDIDTIMPATYVFNNWALKSKMHVIKTNAETFYTKVFGTIALIEQQYVLCSTPDFFLEEPIVFDNAVRMLQRTYAYSLYFNMPASIFNQSTFIENNVYAKYLSPNDVQYTYNNFTMAIYAKEHIVRCLQNTECTSFEALEKAWQQQPIPDNQVGLLYVR